MRRQGLWYLSFMAQAEGRPDRFANQRALFYEHLERSGLKRTQQRDLILETFLGAEEHLLVDELLLRVRRIDPSVGYSTVYRTVNIFLACGIAQVVRLVDSTRRIEPVFQDRHHDHLICLRCGDTTEFFSCTLETAQVDAASLHGFKPLSHSLKIYGLCRKCQEAGDPEG
jgi:Fur family ferric uptake transcriptional regulator